MPSRHLQSLPDLAQAVRDIDNQLQQIRMQNWDFRLRRIVNASPSVDPNDYVIQQELLDKSAGLQEQLDTIKLRLFDSSGNPIKPQELFADCSSGLSVPFGSHGDIVGCTINLNRYGLYVVTAHVSISQQVAVGAVRIYLRVDGGDQTPIIVSQLTTATGTNDMTTVQTLMWPVLKQVEGIWVAKLTADKSVNAGGATINLVNTRLHARWAGADVSTTV